MAVSRLLIYSAVLESKSRNSRVFFAAGIMLLLNVRKSHRLKRGKRSLRTRNYVLIVQSQTSQQRMSVALNLPCLWITSSYQSPPGHSKDQRCSNGRDNGKRSALPSNHFAFNCVRHLSICLPENRNF